MTAEHLVLNDIALNMFMGWVGPEERPGYCRFQKHRLHRLAAEIFHSA